MRILLFLTILLIFFNCGSFVKKNDMRPDNDVLTKQIKSCTGKGSISSFGSFSGRLSLSFISQNDSSFCQFQDFLGRKVLLIWLTPVSIDAWNLIENKKYSNRNINQIIPILSILNPKLITKFLWGEEFTPNGISVDDDSKIEIKLEKSNLNSLNVDKVTFTDISNRQEFSIKIDSRVFRQDSLNLKKYWEIILG